MDKSKIIRDGHMHSPYCPHGTKDAFELYIKKALEGGLKEISFTEHMPFPTSFIRDEALKSSEDAVKEEILISSAPSIEAIEEYFQELKEIKERYKQDLKINIGLEVDYVEGYEEEIKEMLNKYGSLLEDGLVSVHFIKIKESYYCVDYNPKEFGKLVELLGSIEKVYDKYYETLLKAIKADLGIYKPTRIGHPTLVRIFNLEYPVEYKNTELLEELVKELKARDYEVDFNTAGIRKPFCKELYPSGSFAQLVKDYKLKVVYGSDAHNSGDVGRDFNNLIL